MFGIDDALIAALIAGTAEAAPVAPLATAALAGGGSAAAGLGMAGMGGLGAATPTLLGGSLAGAGAAPAASLLGTGGLSAGLGPQIAANLVNPMTQLPADIGGGMSIGSAKVPLDYWKLLQYMNTARGGMSALQGGGDRNISVPPAQRPHVNMVAPIGTNNVTLFDPNRYPYNTRLNLLGRR